MEKMVEGNSKWCRGLSKDMDEVHQKQELQKQMMDQTVVQVS